MPSLDLDHVARRLSQHLATSLPDDQLTGAVLAPFAHDHQTPTLLFTRRAKAVANFPGEVSFPGGRREPDDASLLATALRETHEEIHVPPDHVRVVGRLDDRRVYGRHTIRAHVGFLEPDADPRPHPPEVERIFTVALEELAAPDAYEGRRVEDDATGRTLHYFRVDGETIWGATGHLVADLLEITMGWRPPRDPRRVPSWDDLRREL